MSRMPFLSQEIFLKYLPCFNIPYSWYYRLSVNVNSRKSGKKNNAIQTNKYTLVSFFPKTLFYQFSRFSNAYFLCIGLLQLFPSISDANGIPTYLFPLSVIVIISSIKDLIEDWHRHRSDIIENNRSIQVSEEGCFKTKRWGELLVGDIVKIHRNEYIPADLLILGTSGYSGIAYVETKNLNGETSIEAKVALPAITRFFKRDEIVTHLEVSASCENPSACLDHFSGCINNIKVKKSRLAAYVYGLISVQTLENANKFVQWDTPLQSRCPSAVLSPVNLIIPSFESGKIVDVCGTTLSKQVSNTLENEFTQRCNSSIFDNYDQYEENIWCKTHCNEKEFIVYDQPLYLNIGQFFLRGSSLVNTEWIYGLVVYVSSDTRIFQNNKRQMKFKSSHLEKTYNHHVLYLIFLEFLFCFVISVYAAFFYQNSGDAWYLEWYHKKSDDSSIPSPFPSWRSENPKKVFLNALQVFFSMIILFAYFVPIDLFLMLEITRLFQGGFVVWDRDMMHRSDTKTRTISQNCNLIEELGNVTHLFTDKTGTLTRNIMALRAISVANYLLFPTSNEALVTDKHRTDCDPVNSTKLENNFSFITKTHWTRFFEKIRMDKQAYITARYTILNLSLCHSVLVQNQPAFVYPEDCTCKSIKVDVSSTLPSFVEPHHVILTKCDNSEEWEIASPSLVRYDAGSPDELALVCGAQMCGVEFFSRTFLNRIQLRLLTSSARRLVMGDALNAKWEDWVQDISTNLSPCPVHTTSKFATAWVPLVTFELFEVLEFDNNRKRMSVIIRDPFIDKAVVSDNDSLENPSCCLPMVTILTKGADSQMIKIASREETYISDYINQIAQAGLRTLVLGAKNIPKEQYHWLYDLLNNEREKQFKENIVPGGNGSFVSKIKNTKALEEILLQFEINTRLLGISGVEDQLQDDVPSVLRELRGCGIRCFLLTGDKMETAINIGYASHLLSDYTCNYIIEEQSKDLLTEELKAIFKECNDLGFIHEPEKDLSEKRDQLSRIERKKLPWYKKLLFWCSNTLDTTMPPDFSIPFVSETFMTILQTGNYQKNQTFPKKKKHEKLDHIRDDVNPYIKEDPQSNDNISLSEKKSYKSNLLSDPNNNIQKEFTRERVNDNQKNEGTMVVGLEDSIQNNTDESKNHIFFNLAETESQNKFNFFRSTRKEIRGNDPSMVKEFSLTVDGKTIDLILESKELSSLFFRLSSYAMVVIACRVTPKHKALFVEQTSRFSPTCISTLAVGDGANDIGMILAADVGIGIIGQEGLQASIAADFGIREFRSIRKLLFVHGREALRRNSFLIYYGIFKNIALCSASFVFQFICGFSGQDIYNYWFKSLYATVFVAPSALVFAIMDRQLPHYILHRSPITYHTYASVIWPIIELPIVQALYIKLASLKKRISRFIHTNCFKMLKPLKLKKLKKSLLKKLILFSLKKSTVPAGVHCYSNLIFLIWFLYGVYVGCIICLASLYMLNNAVSVDQKTFSREVVTVGRKFSYLPMNLNFDSSATNTGYMSNKAGIFSSEGKAGFDLDAVGMVVMFQCVLISNLVVALAINSFFALQAVVMIGTLLLFVSLWWITMWQPFITNAIPGLYSVAGMFKMIWSCTAYYFCVFLLIFFCIIPIFTARVFKIIFNPSVITIVKERMLQGVFDVVVARRSVGDKKIMVLVPQRHKVKRHASLPDVQIREIPMQKQYSSLERTGTNISSPNVPLQKHLLQSKELVSNSLASETVQNNVCSNMPIRMDPYAGFAFGYTETIISSPPSIWLLASMATWLGKSVEPFLSKMSRGVHHRLFSKYINFFDAQEPEIQSVTESNKNIRITSSML